MQTELLFADAPTAPATQAKPRKVKEKKAAIANTVHVVPGHREIDDYICGILSEIEYEQRDEITLARLTCGQIERYSEVDEILKRIGGKWAGRQKAHSFPFNPREVIAAISENGIMPAKNPLAYFPTPRAVIDKIFSDDEIGDFISYIETHTDHRILEPSAGTGAFVKYLLEKYPGLKGRIDCVEVDPLKCRVLEKLEAGEVYECAYEDWIPTREYRAVIMNPPFSTPGNKMAYVTHITKAMDQLLGRYGMLVAIAPTGFIVNNNKPSQNFRNLVAETGILMHLPGGDFKESGTMTETCTITLFTSVEPQWRNQPHLNYTSFHSFTLEMFITNTAELQKRLLDLGRALLHGKPQEETEKELESLIATASDRMWKESRQIISLRDEIKEGIRQDLHDSARDYAGDNNRLAA